MARERHLLGEDFGNLLKRNATLLTVFAVLLIIVSGVTIIDDPSRWWVTVLSVLGFSAVIFLFMNARVFIKAAVALFLVSFLGSYAFKIGAAMDPLGLGGSVWMTGLIATFFVSLAISYFKPSGKSRWGVAGLTTMVNFFSTLLITSFGLEVRWATLVSAAFTLVLFCLLYYFSRNSRFKAQNMPTVLMADKTAESLKQAAIDSGRGGWRRVTHEQDSVVVWNEEVAFQLLEVELEQKLGIGGGRRSSYLTHVGANINPWLLWLVHRMLPTRGTKNADIMLVLLDSTNKNGDKAKVIGVQVPDSKKKIPVGILPAKNLLSERKRDRLFTTLEKEFSDYALKLTPAQLNALDSHLPEEQTEDGAQPPKEKLDETSEN